MESPTLFQWPGAVSCGRSALVVPGDGYSALEPILYWVATALVQSGMRVGALVWPDKRKRDPDRRRLVRSGLDLCATGWHRPDLIVAMSSGCVAAELETAVSVIALSPVTSVDTPASIDLALRRGAPGLAVSGSLDGFGSRTALEAMNFVVAEIGGVDHSLEAPGNWQESLDAATRIVALSVEFAHSSLGLR